MLSGRCWACDSGVLGGGRVHEEGGPLGASSGLGSRWGLRAIGIQGFKCWDRMFEGASREEKGWVSRLTLP